MRSFTLAVFVATLGLLAAPSAQACAMRTYDHAEIAKALAAVDAAAAPVVAAPVVTAPVMTVTPPVTAPTPAAPAAGPSTIAEAAPSAPKPPTATAPSS